MKHCTHLSDETTQTIYWTTLNQRRSVVTCPFYDRAMLKCSMTKIRVGMSRLDVQMLLPQIITGIRLEEEVERWAR